MPKLTKNEKGLGQTFIILAVVVVLAVAGVAIWQITKKNNTNKPMANTAATTPVSGTAPSSSCQKAFNDSSLCAFAAHSNINSMAYVANGTATTATGAQSNYTVQNDGRGNTEVTYSSSGNQVSAITLDGVTYVQTGSNATWYEYSTGSSSATSVPNPTSGFNLNLSSTIPKGVTVSKIGTVSCGSLSCYKYKVSVASTPKAVEYVYFDTKDYLLRQWTSTDSSTGISVNLTFSYPSVTITKPSPVQQITT